MKSIVAFISAIGVVRACRMPLSTMEPEFTCSNGDESCYIYVVSELGTGPDEESTPFVGLPSYVCAATPEDVTTDAETWFGSGATFLEGYPKIFDQTELDSMLAEWTCSLGDGFACPLSTMTCKLLTGPTVLETKCVTDVYGTYLVEWTNNYNGYTISEWNEEA